MVEISPLSDSKNTQYVDGMIYIYDKKKSRQKYPQLTLKTSPEDFFFNQPPNQSGNCHTFIKIYNKIEILCKQSLGFFGSKSQQTRAGPRTRLSFPVSFFAVGITQRQRLNNPSTQNFPS